MPQKRKIAVLIESDFFEPEIFYYQHRFPEEGVETTLPRPAMGPASSASPGTSGASHSRAARASRTWTTPRSRVTRRSSCRPAWWRIGFVTAKRQRARAGDRFHEARIRQEVGS